MANRIDININQNYIDKRLDKVLKEIFPNTPFSVFQKLIRKKLVTVNGGKTESAYHIKNGDKINIADFIYDNLTKKSEEGGELEIQNTVLSRDEIQNMLNRIIYKDDKIIAINKPYDLPVQSGSGIKKSVVDFLPFMKFEYQQKPKLVHRLDRHTTGVLLLARDSDTANTLLELFKTKKGLKKEYVARVVGKIKQQKGVIEAPLNKRHDGKIEKVSVDFNHGKEAITEYEIISYDEKTDTTLVRLNLITGRTHQIRVHMKYIGYPIVGDVKYGGDRSIVKGCSKKMHLHAERLTIEKGFLGYNKSLVLKVSSST